MENQSHTQEALMESNRIDNKEQILRSIKENLNYIYIIIMIIANCLISLIRIDDGYIGLKYPDTGIGWALWITQVLLITFIGVSILNAFRRQGIKNGHKVIKDTYNAYLKVITSQTGEINPRSEKEYMHAMTVRDSIGKGTILVLFNLLAFSAAITANLNAIFALVLNIVISVSFGIKAMLEAEDFVITELVIWYKLEIKKLTQKLTKAKERKKNERN